MYKPKKYGKDNKNFFLTGNSDGLDPVLFRNIQVVSEEVAQKLVNETLPTGVALTDAANISTDASLGTDFYVTLGGDRNFNDPTNNTDWKTIKFWITQDNTGSRSATWNTAFRFSADLPSPTLTTTANFMDLIEFTYNPIYGTWDCTKIVKGFEPPP